MGQFGLQYLCVSSTGKEDVVFVVAGTEPMLQGQAETSSLGARVDARMQKPVCLSW